MSLIRPYADLHKALNGPGDQRPTAQQIIKDYGLEGEWHGRVVLITGASPGGLGVEIARAIHKTGADVVITVRDQAKGNEVAKDILKDGEDGRVEVLTMDLASLKSVRKAAETFLAKYDKLNVLINNAGKSSYPSLEVHC